MPILLKYWKQLGVLLLCLACYAGGRWGSSGGTATTSDKIAETQTTEQVDKTQDTDHLDKVTEITKKPDGTVVTKITDHSKITETKQDTENTQTKVDETKTTSTPVADPYRPSYRLGVQVHNDLGLTWKPAYSIDTGYRVIGNLWGTASYNLGDHQLGVGLSFDF